MKNQTVKICVAYTGEAVDNGSMNVNELAPALLALSNLVGKANRVLNEDNSTVEVRLSAHLERGSFEMTLEILRNLSEQIKLFLFDGKYSILDIIGIIGFASTVSGVNAVSLIEFMRWLKARRIKKVENVDKNNVRVLIENDEKEISIGAWILYSSKEIHQHIEGIIKPLQNNGVNSFEIRDNENKTTITSIKSEETEYFSDLPPEEELEESKSVQKLILKIVNVNFERNLKWRFDDGESKFFAEIKDEDFLNIVDSGKISFTQGDAILAEVETLQQYTKTELRKTVKTILKIFKIIKKRERMEIILKE